MRGWVQALAFATGLLVTSTSRGAEASPKFSLNAMTIGARGSTDLGLGMLEARAMLSPHFHLTVTPTVVLFEGGETEHQLRAAATLLVNAGPVVVDDRNLWVFSDAGTTRYRNRLRLTHPISLSRQVLRLQVLNEAFYEKGDRGWFRNMYGAGVGVDVRRSISIDAYWLQQDDHGKEPSSLVLLMLTAHLF